jgi:hypothetical protein
VRIGKYVSFLLDLPLHPLSDKPFRVPDLVFLICRPVVFRDVSTSHQAYSLIITVIFDTAFSHARFVSGNTHFSVYERRVICIVDSCCDVIVFPRVTASLSTKGRC